MDFKKLIMLVNVILILIFNGCMTVNLEGSTVTGTEGLEKVNLNILLPENVFSGEFNILLNQYAKINQGIEINVKTVTNDENYRETLRIALITGDVDMFILPDKEYVEYFNDNLAEMNEIELNKFIPPEINTKINTDGKIYALPANMEGYGFLYNYMFLRNYAGLAYQELTGFEQIEEAAKSINQKIKEGKFTNTYPELKAVFYKGKPPLKNEGLENALVPYQKNIVKEENGEKKALRYAEDFNKLLDLHVDYGYSGSEFDLGIESLTNGEVVFCLGSTEDLRKHNSYSLVEYDILPIPIKIENEETGKIYNIPSGICSYWGVNVDSEIMSRDLAVKLLEYMYISENGKSFLIHRLGFIPPYNNFDKDDFSVGAGKTLFDYFMNNGTIPMDNTATPVDFTENLYYATDKYLENRLSNSDLLKYLENIWE